MKIGYAHPSDDDNSLERQLQALRDVGCHRILTDGHEGEISGVESRASLGSVLDGLGNDDMLIVWRLDRLGRSLEDVITILRSLEKRGAEFRSIAEGIDTTADGGRSLFKIVDAFANVKRGRIVDRTKAGLHAAKARGKRLGRPPALTPQ
ncbi:recombinase family protein [uncultured Erythrobacter sp.]|uniref:recombinase family protein n=1 Tax=uncultured Erythrobacter sp. TaxID=263913 RepID=UPI002602F3E3|nr:recombinase family protein [uncultured Erythrobacter sp.]